MNFQKEAKRRALLFLLLFLVIFSFVIVSMVYGKYIDEMDSNVNVDVTAQGVLDITVNDNGNGVYTVKNTDFSNMPAYVRLAIVVGLKNADGKLWAASVTEGVEYTLAVNNCTKLSDGYYYYVGTLQQNSSFDVTVSPKTLPDGYTLHVRVVAEGIQCLPESAVEDAWSASFDTSSSTWSKVVSN